MRTKLYKYRFRLPSEDWIELENLTLSMVIHFMYEHFRIYHNISNLDINISRDVVYNILNRPHKSHSLFRNRVIIIRQSPIPSF